MCVEDENIKSCACGFFFIYQMYWCLLLIVLWRILFRSYSNPRKIRFRAYPYGLGILIHSTRHLHKFVLHVGESFCRNCIQWHTIVYGDMQLYTVTYNYMQWHAIYIQWHTDRLSEHGKWNQGLGSMHSILVILKTKPDNKLLIKHFCLHGTELNCCTAIHSGCSRGPARCMIATSSYLL